MIDAFLAVEDEELLPPQRRQRPQPVPGHAVELRVRLAAAGRVDDHDAGGQERVPRRASSATCRYKILQIHYAMMLERKYTKDEILERYLNTVFFGNNAYGIQAAAETYFGKTVDQLTFDRGGVPRRARAVAVGLRPDRQPRAQPRPLRPGDQPARGGRHHHHGRGRRPARPRHRFEIPARVQSIAEGGTPPPRTYYTEALTRLPAQPPLDRPRRLDDTPEERYSALYRGGCSIHTTFDPDLQTLAEHARNVLPDTPQGFDAAIVSLDTETGAIRAMVGGKGFVPGDPRGQPGAARRARPARASSCSSSPRRCRPASRPTT